MKLILPDGFDSHRTLIEVASENVHMEMTAGELYSILSVLDKAGELPKGSYTRFEIQAVLAFSEASAEAMRK